MTEFPQVYLIRHGETEWALSHKHTGRTDIPLTENGHRQAKLAATHFTNPDSKVVRMQAINRVFCSPLLRARQTLEELREAIASAGKEGAAPLALPEGTTVDSELQEWDYGDYEGQKSADISRSRGSEWNLFRDGCPNGESTADVGARCDKVIGRLRRCGEAGSGPKKHCPTCESGRHCADCGDALVVSHGHCLRVLAARWLGLEPEAGQLLVLDTATLCVLGYEHNFSEPIIRVWNAQP